MEVRRDRRLTKTLIGLPLAHLVLLIYFSGCSGGSSAPPPSFTLVLSNSSITVHQGATTPAVTLTVQPQNGFSGSVSVSITGLPSGVTSNPSSPVTLQSSASQQITFTASSSATVGTATVAFLGSSGNLSNSTNLSLTVASGPAPNFTVAISPSFVTLQQGATTAPLTIDVQPQNGFFQSVSVSIGGLPAGVTTNPSQPFNIVPPGSQQFTLSASPTTAPGSATLVFTVTGGGLTNSADVSLTLEKAQPLPSLGRTNFVRIDSTPASAFALSEPTHRVMILDSARNQLFVANRGLNRVDVLDAASGKSLASIPVSVPTSVELTPDGSRVWVGTEVEEMDAIDPNTLQIIERLPFAGVSTSGLISNIPEGIVFTSNGTALLSLRQEGTTGTILAQWNPTTNTFTNRSPFGPGIGSVARSLDYSKVLVASDNSSGTIVLYDAATDSFPRTTQFSFSFVQFLAANLNGTQFAAWVFLPGTSSQLVLLDGNLNTLTTLNVGQIGGIVYSRDGKFLYYSDNVEQINSPSVIHILDAQTFQPVGLVPDLEGAPLSVLMDVDSTGLLFGISGHGVSFLDSSTPRNLPFTAPIVAGPPAVTPQQGTVGSSTPVSIFGVNFESPAGVTFGTQMASGVSVSSSIQINAAAPPASSPGPVNVGLVFPSGWTSLAPQAFTYGPVALFLSATAGRPVGGDSIQIFGFGFGTSASQVSVSLNGKPGTVTQLLTTQQTFQQLAGFSTPPYPLQAMTITTPAGSPGPADLTIVTSAGSFTLPAAFRYLQTVQTFSNAASLRFITYDRQRQRLYATANDHIVVFDLTSQQFLSPIIPPGGPFANSDLRQAVLTPDSSTLVVADFGQSAVYLISPDQPSNATTIHIPPPPASPTPNGPARIAPTSTGKIFVASTFAGTGFCPCLNEIDLVSKAVTNVSAISTTELPLLAGNPAGDKVLLSLGDNSGGDLFLWTAATNAFQHRNLTTFSFQDAAIAGDGNVFATGGGGLGIGQTPVLLDATLRFSMVPQYVDVQSPNSFFVPGEAIHPSGSLFYQPFDSFLDVIDVQHGNLRERLLLPESFLSGFSAMDHASLALDENGQRLFALTKSGITIMQLSAVPVSIGSVQPAQGSASGGTSVTIRGSGFAPGATVSFGSAIASAVINDQNTIQVTTPSGSVGSVRVTITNPDGRTYSLDAAFSYN